MPKKIPFNPAHPERICWGCDKYCAVGAMMCGNGSDRAQHPYELFGEYWCDWSADGEDAHPETAATLDADGVDRSSAEPVR
jgi:hypothetical protein